VKTAEQNPFSLLHSCPSGLCKWQAQLSRTSRRLLAHPETSSKTVSIPTRPIWKCSEFSTNCLSLFKV